MDGAIDGHHPYFAPRPYPRRSPGNSPLKGRLVVVVDGNVGRGRTMGAVYSANGAATALVTDLADHTHGDLGPSAPVPELLIVHATFPTEELLRALGPGGDGPGVVLVGDRPRAVEHGWQSTPEDPSDEDLVIAALRALEARSLRSENLELRQQLEGRHSFGRIMTRDPKLGEVLSTLKSVADTKATVLILGETGTGKSMLARVLHHSSSRRSAPFIEVNCGALPPGLLEAELFGHAKGAFTGADGERAGRFEAADSGSIFLDEIDSAPLELQVKLLRVVQDRLFERVGETKSRQVDVRIVVATNANLQAKVASGEFREDLYWRLNVVEVSLPPLRSRPRDLAPLVESFVETFAREYKKPVQGVTPAALGALAAQPWPGNVRQLEHAIERAVLLAPTEAGRPPRALDLGDLDAKLRGDAESPVDSTTQSLPRGLAWLSDLTAILPLKSALEGPERLLIERALRIHGGRRDRAASALGVNRSTLFNKMRKYGLLDLK